MSQASEWKHEYILSNGVKLHYVTSGSGPLMLMLHGFPEFWYSWRHQIREFARDYQVVALDLRGYNNSDKPPQKSAYQIAELSKDVAGVIRGLGYQNSVLVGHDWGGSIAWNFAYAYPEMLSRLIVMNMPHPAKFSAGLRRRQQLLRSWYIFFFQLPLIPELRLQRSDYQAMVDVMRSSAIDKSAFTQADIEAFKQAAAKPGALRAMLNYYRNINIILGQRNWGMLDIPTLMIWGERDIFLGQELTYGTEEYVRDLQIRYIPNCSHWVQQEQPLLVNQYMGEFLCMRSPT